MITVQIKLLPNTLSNKSINKKFKLLSLENKLHQKRLSYINMDERQNKDNKIDNDTADHIESIFQIPASQRTCEQNSEALSLLRQLYFFRSKISEGSCNESLIVKCAESMNFEVIPPGSAIYHNGDMSDKIYILIKGRIRRYVKRIMDAAVSDSKAESIKSNTIKESEQIELPNSGSVVFDKIPQSVSINRLSGPENISPQHNRAPSLNNARLSHWGQLKEAPSPLFGHDKMKSRKPIRPTNFKLKVETKQQNADFQHFPDSAGEASNTSSHRSAKFLKSKQSLGSEVNILSYRADQAQAKNFSPAQSTSSVEFVDYTPQIQVQVERESSSNQPKEDIFKSYQYYYFKELPVFEGFYQHRDMYFMSGKFRFRHIRTYFPGESFGEIGVSFESNRIATLIAETATCLLSIDRATCKSLLSEHLKNNRDKVQFFQKLFPTTPTKDVSDFASYFLRKVVYQGTDIFKQNDAVDSIYFIREGEIALSKQVTVYSEGKEKLTPRGLTSEFEKAVSVAILSEKQYFGEEQLFKVSKRIFTATVSSRQCTILKISIKNFKMLAALYGDIASQLEDECKVKPYWRFERIKELGKQAHDEAVIKVKQEKLSRASTTLSMDQIINKKIVEHKEDHDEQQAVNKHTFSHMTSKLLQYNVLSLADQKQLEKLAAGKLKYAHDQVKTRNKFELNHLGFKAQSKKPLSIWLSSLKARCCGQPRLKELIKFREGETKEEDESSNQAAIDDVRRSSLSLKRISKSINHVIKSRSSSQLYEQSFVKNIPTFADNSKSVSNLNESVMIYEQSTKRQAKRPVLNKFNFPDLLINRFALPSRKQNSMKELFRKKSIDTSDVSTIAPVYQEGTKNSDTIAAPSGNNSNKHFEQEIIGVSWSGRVSPILPSINSAKMSNILTSKRKSLPHHFYDNRK